LDQFYVINFFFLGRYFQ